MIFFKKLPYPDKRSGKFCNLVEINKYFFYFQRSEMGDFDRFVLKRAKIERNRLKKKFFVQMVKNASVNAKK